MAKQLTNEQKAARKIRQQIRNAAKAAGISTKEYRQLHGITAATIRLQASDSNPISTLKTVAKIEKAVDLSNKPKHIIVKNSIYGYSHLMELAPNGHYLPKEKIYN